jgi:transcriptional regulator with XRE-family HTH domain
MRTAIMHDPSLFPFFPSERKECTLKAVALQGEKRIAAYGISVYHARMADAPSSVSRKLKQLRQRAGLSIREVAHALGMENGSSYQHYEDRFRKPFLPLDFAQRLVPIFGAKGIEADELFALAGVDGGSGRGLGVKNGSSPGTLRIDELDVRASAGDGLTGDSEKVVAEWQLPSEVVRYHSSAPASELRFITVLGDSMEPTLQPGQRVLVDTGDRTPTPPGIFVVWDGLGLVVKRVQTLAHSEPMRVRITSDNPKYEGYERSLAEAYIQGRVIGQWRGL